MRFSRKRYQSSQYIEIILMKNYSGRPLSMFSLIYLTCFVDLTEWKKL